MRAPSQGSSSFKDIITEFLKQYELTRSSLSAFFLRLRDDPDRRIDKIWKKIVDDNPSIDTASERELFLKRLTDAWDAAVLADIMAKIDEVNLQEVRDKKRKMKKALARSFSKMSAKELLALLHDASTDLQQFAKLEDKLEELRQNRLYPILNIRSNHAGSRTRTAFMRVASRRMHETSGKWHDKEVADLTDIAFPDRETTVRSVQAARQFTRRRRGA
jgi:hypothetical protein